MQPLYLTRLYCTLSRIPIEPFRSRSEGVSEGLRRPAAESLPFRPTRALYPVGVPKHIVGREACWRPSRESPGATPTRGRDAVAVSRSVESEAQFQCAVDPFHDLRVQLADDRVDAFLDGDDSDLVETNRRVLLER